MDREFPEEEAPRKRVKISVDPADDQPNVGVPIPATKDSPLRKQPRSADESQTPLADVQAMKEAEVGITKFVSPDLPGFTGILKKR
jgi:tRNA pseudouridine13 synthase